MGLPLLSNPLLLLKATYLQGVLNTGKHVRLFSNNFLPDPSTPLSSFIECTFTGYAAISLAGLFSAPTLVQNGQYQIDSGFLSFVCTGGAGQTIYGWYIDDGTSMLMCQLISPSFPITAGGTYPLDLRPQEISQSIL